MIHSESQNNIQLLKLVIIYTIEKPYRNIIYFGNISCVDSVLHSYH